MSQLLRTGYLGLLFTMLLDASDHLIAGAAAPPVFSFNFSAAPWPSTYSQDLVFQDDADEPRTAGPVDLTCTWDTQVCRNGGRMSYAHPVQLYQAANGRISKVASFSTSFTFAIRPIVVTESAGGNLGLISDNKAATDIAPDDRFIAVEFDIGNKYDNDPKTDHIAIDINSVVGSDNTTYLPRNVTLNGTMIADIVFDSSTRMLVASLGFLDHPSSSPPPPPVQVAVGFSAATAECAESCQILSWSFNSTLPLLHQDTHNIARLLVELIIGGALVFALVLWFLLSCWEQKRIRNVFDKGTGGARRFEYRNLAAATDHFSEDRKLGQGAFGAVYSGHLKLLDHQVAVKKIVRESSEGHKDFFAEVRTISEAKHKNLVKFFGWCSRGHSWNILRFMCSCFWSKKNSELFLVYELMTNGNLNDYLYKSESSEVLSWQTRYKIAKDIGSGLLYLHHECDPHILHRDIKPGNVLLDENFNAKLADFGLSRMANQDNATLLTTAIGSEGYLDPQCLKHGKVPFKRSSDVYSFGIALLEIACARRHREQIWDLYRSGGNVVEAADTRLTMGGGLDMREIERVIVLGLWCSALQTQHRPSMRQAMDVLERDGPLPDLNSLIVVNTTLASTTEEDASSAPAAGNRYDCDEAPLLIPG
uniref:Protein kinase domain-containing protein n=1 Tax=Oryza rufipogon TaxID=4529 RepID=A0A0E0P4Z9_ORYRU